MGSLEILRQGVWSSLTGGWFYDPHQNVFCNTVHLYIWLFLLCTPFVTYLYFKTLTTWGIYCVSIAILMATLKILNLGFHAMYDEAQAMSSSEANLKSSSTKALRETSGDEDAGIEMQVLGSSEMPSRLSVENQSDEISCANSAMSFDYPEPSSTIDFKVDVHRKNSSESSDSVGIYPSTALQNSIITYNAEVCSTANHRRVGSGGVGALVLNNSSAKLDNDTNNDLKEVIHHNSDRLEKLVNSRSHSKDRTDEIFVSCKYVDRPGRHQNRHESFEKDERKSKSAHSKLQRQISLDSEQMPIDRDAGASTSSSKLQRHRSTDGHEERHAQKNKSNVSLVLPSQSSSHHHHHHHHLGHHHSTSSGGGGGGGHHNHSRIQSLASDLYLENNYTTKSELAIENIPGMDHHISNKNFTLQKSIPMRRDSNSTMSALQLPITGAGTSSSTRNRRHSNIVNNTGAVRRIKSTALEICAQQPSTSNLAPHPNSVEAIGGQIIRNPQHSILPLPSKTLSRNPHLNLFPKSSLISTNNLNSTVDPVYPIEEQADESGGCPSGRSLSDEFGLNQNSESDDGDDEDSHGTHSHQHQRQSITESESDLDRLQLQSTDSDTENNGSRSPLLEVRNRVPIFIVDKIAGGGTGGGGGGDGSKKSDKGGGDILAKNITSRIKKEILGKGGGGADNDEDSEEGPSSDGEQASAGSKDMLLTDKDVPQYITLNFNIFKENIDETAFASFHPDGTPADMPLRNLGAIPKSRTRSSPSSRRFSAEEHCRPSRIGLPRHFCSTNYFDSNSAIASTSGASTSHTPIGSIPSYSNILNSRIGEHQIIPVSTQCLTTTFQPRARANRLRAETYAVLEPNRRRQLKIRRSTRQKYQQRTSVDSTSKDDPDSQAQVHPDFVGGPSRRFLNDSVERMITSSSLYGYEIPGDHLPVPTAHVSISRVDFNETNFPDFGRHFNTTEKPAQPKRYYKFPMHLFGSKKQLKISMDRLQLLALFDRDSGYLQVYLAIILAVLVAMLGALVLDKHFYADIYAFIFCFVIAGSQYSLLKSVQPDAASPIHGFNKIVSFSRPIYFCVCSGLLLLSHRVALESENTATSITIFGFAYYQKEFFDHLQHVLSIMLLIFPLFFSLGLFPQINTFLMYLLEQIDMHVFGGNAVCSLTAAFIAIIRSIVACLLLYGPAFGGLTEPKGTQHVLFSIFCALIVSVSYHLSRSASDFTCIWNLIKSSLLFHPDDDDEELTAVQPPKRDSVLRKKSSQGSHIDDSATVPGSAEILTPIERKMDDTAFNSTGGGTAHDTSIDETDLLDPLPKKLQSTVNNRLRNDLLICSFLGVVVMSLHSSTIFTVLQPDLNFVLYALAIVVGVLLHYIIPQMRKHLPWLCIARPILRQHEHGQFEASEASRVMWFESTYIILSFFEKNILYPLIFLSALTADSATIANKFGTHLGTALIVVAGLKCIRSSYSHPSTQYLILTFTVLFFRLDFKSATETFLIDYFLVAIVFKKTTEFLLKMQFVVTYIAPWQITWGSAFHAFAQPFSVPHSAMLFLQAGISAILSTPLNPFLGSAIFLTSYVRPIKFWERDYNTRRIDHSNTRLSSQLERDLGADDNNLNSIFYEHLTRSLQHSLCGDLLLGRWGNVSQGDCFVLASDYLNCLVHIIELGNGLCTFQMRGLEFRGTYCQQREVEAISEGVEENEGCCCCSPGHLPHMLSANAMFSTRWLAWQVIAAQYVLEGYSISDNSAVATLQVFEFRKVLITYYVKSIIYYTIRSQKLQEWLQSHAIQDALQSTLDRQFVDLDPIFNHNLDDDYDFRASGVTRNSFCGIYLEWIQFCCMKRQNTTPQTVDESVSPQTPRSSTNPTPSPRDNNQTSHGAAQNSKPENLSEEPNPTENSSINMSRDSPLVSLCLALALLGRRTLATASHSSSSGVEFFLHGLHALFKGDFRITSPRDEWVFADMELLHGVVAPAVRMSLKLHQDHFLSPDEYEDPDALFEAIDSHSHELVISHEADPLWRNAVLRGAPNLLALRHVMEDGSDEYRVIRLTKRFLSFRVIKLNRECVRGLWAGQQQELIYLRNRNPERGSIQNAKQALRNIINSSCDQPIGYPIYVSPLTTSYAETNEQLCKIIGGAITLEMLKNMVHEFWNRVRQRCREGCSSGSGVDGELGEIQGVYCSAQTPSNTLSGTTGTLSYGSQSISIAGAGIRGSLASMSKPTSSTLIAGILNRERVDNERESVRERGTAKRATHRVDRERRATLPAANNRESTKTSSTNSSVKLQENIESACGINIASPNQKSTASSKTLPSGNIIYFSNKSSDRLVPPPPMLSSDRSDERLTDPMSVQQQLQHIVLYPVQNIQLNQEVIVYDIGEIYDCLDLGRRIDVVWPNEQMRSTGGRSSWKDWTPKQGMVGKIVHYWQPNHGDCHFRSNYNRTILLIQIGDRYVPIGEKGVKLYINPSEEHNELELANEEDEEEEEDEGAVEEIDGDDEHEEEDDVDIKEKEASIDVSVTKEEENSASAASMKESENIDCLEEQNNLPTTLLALENAHDVTDVVDEQPQQQHHEVNSIVSRNNSVELENVKPES